MSYKSAGRDTVLALAPAVYFAPAVARRIHAGNIRPQEGYFAFDLRGDTPIRQMPKI